MARKAPIYKALLSKRPSRSALLIPAEPVAETPLAERLKEVGLYGVLCIPETYLPLFPDAERVEVVQDSIIGNFSFSETGRSCIVPGKTVVLGPEELGLNSFSPHLPPDSKQEFFVGFKGSGAVIKNEDALEYLRYKGLSVREGGGRSAGEAQEEATYGFTGWSFNNRPFGAQNLRYVIADIRDTKLVEQLNRERRLGLKITPHVIGYRLPDSIVALCAAECGFDYSNGFGQEVRLTPSGMRPLDNLGKAPDQDVGNISKILVTDFANLLMSVPRTIRRAEDGWEYLVVGEFDERFAYNHLPGNCYLSKDVVIAPTGEYFTDGESLNWHESPEDRLPHDLGLLLGGYLYDSAAIVSRVCGKAHDFDSVKEAILREVNSAGLMKIERNRDTYTFSFEDFDGSLEFHTLPIRVVEGSSVATGR